MVSIFEKSWSLSGPYRDHFGIGTRVGDTGIVTNLMEHFLWVNLHAHVERLVGLLNVLRRSVFLVDIGGARTVNESSEPGLLIASDRVND